eukprot:CAMPEP_0113901166 /NCGR_PEP_ID=MMETSP0780_2-20120614/21094_1 /TAXON_ID=652834 /ORGANISM="Palpitomonas bilix" /LENGTH=314 /DNA_ID=CAMNT_0000893731 /DNA_START=116 /DNA_END=1060 /DNA_ORIENTATION=- /assembly_acc=CAM_ASM_000599
MNALRLMDDMMGSDPFFGGATRMMQKMEEHHKQMRQAMFGGEDPFAAFSSPSLIGDAERGGGGRAIAGRERPSGARSLLNDDFSSGGGGGFFSSSSSSMTAGMGGGSGQPVVMRSRTMIKKGPGGVMEKQHMSSNSATGEERIMLQRGMGEGRVRTVDRRRNARGEEECVDDLHGYEDPHQFDRDWEALTRGGQYFGGEAGGMRGGRDGRSRYGQDQPVHAHPHRREAHNSRRREIPPSHDFDHARPALPPSSRAWREESGHNPTTYTSSPRRRPAEAAAGALPPARHRHVEPLQPALRNPAAGGGRVKGSRLD